MCVQAVNLRVPAPVTLNDRKRSTRNGGGVATPAVCPSAAGSRVLIIQRWSLTVGDSVLL